MLLIKDLKFHWGDGPFALQIPSLSIAAGTMTAITGPSGCGKTTLLNLIAGILQPADGFVAVDGKNVSQMSDADRRLFRLKTVGMVFQDFRLIEYLNVLENILLPCRLDNSVGVTFKQRAAADLLLQNVGLQGSGQKSVGRLSQGERQRVAICRALLLKPRLLLADEPTGNLDPKTAAEVLKLLLLQARSCGMSMIMVTHDHSILPLFDQHIPFEQFLSSGGQAAVATPAGDPEVAG